ncbi:MAG: hypothetical protein ACRD1K_18865, partial [Acidimicrobiales bacterium]
MTEPAATVDAVVGFFVDFLAAEGGLYEECGGLVTCVVPDGLARLLDLPETVTVTADPDASREDGAMLLGPGHPVVDSAAGRVLSAADVGVFHLGAPAGPPPSLEALLPRVRDQVGVDHGRVDSSGGAPGAARLPVMRAGALITYDVSPDDRFHERAEVWVDATTGLELPPDVVALATAPGAGPAPEPAGQVLAYDQAAAVAAAHRLLEVGAGGRLAELARQRGADTARREESARTTEYYRDALASLEHRMATASPERARLLQAQVATVGAEQARRLREIDDKFERRFQVTPYRLHVVTLSVLSLPLVVRRGPRTWPLTILWLARTGRALPLRCPGCQQPAPLVAGKRHLGCRSCLSGASLAPEAAPVAPAPGPVA